jgi:hypothetical protein
VHTSVLLSSATLLTACTPASSGVAEHALTSVWTGVKVERDEVLGSASWSTIFADAAGRPLVVDHWSDGQRDALVSQERYQYDEEGLPVEYAVDADGDGVFDSRTTWERQEEETEVVYSSWQVSGWLPYHRILYVYADGLLQRVEADVGADGSVDQTWQWLYEASRPVRMEQRDAFDLETATAVWTYAEPAPSLDHREEDDTDADGVVDVVHDRVFDAEGRLVREQEVDTEDPDAVTVTTTSWDEDRVLLRTRCSPWEVMLEQDDYDEHGLDLQRRSELDDLDDGILEGSFLEVWDWTWS